MEMPKLLAPAISYAKEGFPVSPIIAYVVFIITHYFNTKMLKDGNGKTVFLRFLLIKISFVVPELFQRLESPF